MGVISWFRRSRAVVQASGEQDGGAVAVLDPVDRTDQDRTKDAEQEPRPGVPTARTAPDAGAEAVEADGEAEGRATAENAVPEDDSHEHSRLERPDTGDEAMGVMDNLKGMAEELKDKASHLAGQHAEKIDEVVDKAGDAIDKVTKGKYSEKIATGTEKAKHAVDGFAEKPTEATGEAGPEEAKPTGEAGPEDAKPTGEAGTTES